MTDAFPSFGLYTTLLTSCYSSGSFPLHWVKYKLQKKNQHPWWPGDCFRLMLSPFVRQHKSPARQVDFTPCPVSASHTPTAPQPSNDPRIPGTTMVLLVVPACSGGASGLAPALWCCWRWVLLWRWQKAHELLLEVLLSSRSYIHSETLLGSY